MTNLLIKDFFVQKRTFLFALGYSIFVLVAFQSEVFAESAYIMGAMATAYMLVLGACAYEEKNNSDVILNSLPMPRNTIVKARYLSALVFTAAAFIIIGLVGFLMRSVGMPIPLRYVKISDVLAVVISLGLLVSVYFPVYFRYGYIKSRFFNIIIFLLAFFVPALAAPYFRGMGDFALLNQLGTRIAALAGWQLGVVAVLGVIVAMFLSMLISIKFYEKREF